MPEEANHGVIFDYDGYFTFLFDHDESAALLELARISDNETVSIHEVALLHYLLRSSMVLTAGAGSGATKGLKTYSEICLQAAQAYAPHFAKSATLPPPKWAEFFHHRVVSRLRTKFPGVDQIVIRATFDDRLYARSFAKDQTIYVSAFTYEYLRTINLVLWSYVASIVEGDIEAAEVDQLRLIEKLLPYILATRGGSINYSGLPIVRARDLNALTLAKWTTQVQLTFMLAHEYAHLLLDHDKAQLDTREAETQADLFAADLLFELDWQHIGIGDIWIAIRWLFRFLALDRIIGTLLACKEVDWDQRIVLDREIPFMNYVGARQEQVAGLDNLLELTGSYLLMAAKRDTRNAPEEWLTGAAAEFFKSNGFPS